MELKLSREQELVRKMVRDFTENEIAPIAAETDKTSEYPAETIDKLFRYGVMGMGVPKEYGGAGADDLSASIAIEEISKACASTGDIVATHNGLCCNPILTYRYRGAEEKISSDADHRQKGRRFLPDRAECRIRRIQGNYDSCS
jgi:butyryl-CoA dehydrogenase